MDQEELTIVFKIGTLSVENALHAVRAGLEMKGSQMEGFHLDGKPINLDTAASILARKRQTTFDLSGQGYEFQLGSVRRFNLDFISIKTTAQARSEWDQWVNRFIEDPNFLMAWLANVEYEFWQNAEDFLVFSANERNFNHLPTKSNELPPPLEQLVVDISQNPGRRLLRVGYYEVVGAVMWLGEHFWVITGASKTDVARTPWLLASTPVASILRIEAYPDLFTEKNPESEEVQRKLRLLLFPKSTAS